MSFDKDLPDDLQGTVPTRPQREDESYAESSVPIRSTRRKPSPRSVTRAIKARKESGVEHLVKCEEAYLCIDDANRGEVLRCRSGWAGDRHHESPVTTNATNESSNKSSAFMRLTSRYVGAGAVRVSETVLPDRRQKPFSFGPAPARSCLRFRTTRRN